MRPKFGSAMHGFRQRREMQRKSSCTWLQRERSDVGWPTRCAPPPRPAATDGMGRTVAGQGAPVTSRAGSQVTMVDRDRPEVEQ